MGEGEVDYQEGKPGKACWGLVGVRQQIEDEPCGVWIIQWGETTTSEQVHGKVDYQERRKGAVDWEWVSIH